MKRDFYSVVFVAIVLWISNFTASFFLGLGDAEALYYCYGRHPSLSYLDHPPLVGWLLFLSNTVAGAENVYSVRIVSLGMAFLAVIFTYFLTRDVFGNRAAGWAPLLLLATPVFSIGTIAMTPDSALVALWPLFTWQLYLAGVDDRNGRWTKLGRPVLLGAILGLAFLAKYTGICLAITACAALATKPYKKYRWKAGFFLGAFVAVIVASPVLIWNLEHDFAGFYHRMVWTQEGAGLSFRNAGALVGGQLLYVGPLILVLFCVATVHYWKKRRENRGAFLLLLSSMPALVATYALALWSDVAEPHWPAIAYMPLFAAASGLISGLESRILKLARFAVAYGLAVLVVAHIVILTPLLPVISSTEIYKREYDLGNELRGWPEVAEAVRELNPEGKPVVAAFYTQCSQLFFALGEKGDPPVRCISPEMDDFDIWYPDFVPPGSGIIFVTDNRFDFDVRELLPGFESVEEPRTVEISRGGIPVREFEIWSLRKI